MNNIDYHCIYNPFMAHDPIHSMNNNSITPTGLYHADGMNAAKFVTINNKKPINHYERKIKKRVEVPWLTRCREAPGYSTYLNETARANKDPLPDYFIPASVVGKDYVNEEFMRNNSILEGFGTVSNYTNWIIIFLVFILVIWTINKFRNI